MTNSETVFLETRFLGVSRGSITDYRLPITDYRLWELPAILTQVASYLSWSG
ncbi:hypothetical protein [Microseira wollei]|uniref:Uncharacterized protein n=1 Tax=Microseira wollei NIES-4236 TaxID=2530354 RepID=A0AAV3X9B9_9CYAN|nr:hypothetical protein [Microseira wollei]GET38763.1 hypothetical protein MiSe_35220 [Microseira wollei NIES-4236]